MPKLSIIVPIYKVEKYLNRCVDSILTQTFRDFELILVDDGSPDNCGKICDEYASKDNRVKVVHKENGGLSDARNAGIDIAVGDYLGFVDSDDYIAEDMYELLVKNLEKYDADISVCGVYDCFDECIRKQDIKQGIFTLNREEAVEYFLGGKGIGLFAVNKIYKNKVFKNVRYPLNRLYEDAFIWLDLVLNTQKIVVDSSPKYFYVHRDDSITVSRFNKKYYDIIDAHKRNLEIIKSKFPSQNMVGEFRMFWSYKQLLYILAFDSKQNRKNYRNDIKKSCSIIRKSFLKILNNKYNSKAQLILYVLICINPYLFMFILRRFKFKGGF